MGSVSPRVIGRPWQGHDGGSEGEVGLQYSIIYAHGHPTLHIEHYQGWRMGNGHNYYHWPWVCKELLILSRGTPFRLHVFQSSWPKLCSFFRISRAHSIFVQWPIHNNSLLSFYPIPACLSSSFSSPLAPSWDTLPSLAARLQLLLWRRSCRHHPLLILSVK